MRISTNQIFNNGIAAIQREQDDLARVQLQLASGKRMLSPADDPRGTVQSLQIRERIAAVDQFARNAQGATSRLQQEETILQQLGTALQRVRELTVQAANATQTDESRHSIAVEVRQILEAIVDAANSRDANGEYLFAGFKSGSRPFVSNATGDIEYLGDGGQRQVALSPDRKIAVGDSGEAFMTIPRGNGVFIVTPDAGNTGSAWAAGTEVVDPTAITAESFTILMTSATTYDVLDSTSTVIASGTYSSGDAIDINGRRVLLQGAPQAGDSFAVEPAGTTSVFAVVGDLVAALEAPHNDDTSRAELNQSIGSTMQNLDQALGRFLEIRTEVGARLNTIDSQGIVDEKKKLELQTTLSQVEDLDFAEAVSRLALQQAALEAAQQAYVEVTRLSLFDFIR